MNCYFEKFRTNRIGGFNIVRVVPIEIYITLQYTKCESGNILLKLYFVICTYKYKMCLTTIH